jgi:hypothetical protein
MLPDPISKVTQPFAQIWDFITATKNPFNLVASSSHELVIVWIVVNIFLSSPPVSSNLFLNVRRSMYKSFSIALFILWTSPLFQAIISLFSRTSQHGQQ